MNMPISSKKWPFFSKIMKNRNFKWFLRYQWDFAQSHLVWMAESASTWKRIMNAPVQTSLKEKTAKILRINANFQITNVQVNPTIFNFYRNSIKICIFFFRKMTFQKLYICYFEEAMGILTFLNVTKTNVNTHKFSQIRI